MIRLDTTTRKLQAVLSGVVAANQLPIVVSYSDKTSTTYNGGTALSNTNSTTAVDACVAPAASTIRDIDLISIKNLDTAVATITIRLNDNGTLYIIAILALNAGDQAIYTHGDGWRVLSSTGEIKTVSIATIADGDKGDIVVSGAGTIWTVEAYIAKLTVLQTFTASQRGTVTTDNDLSFDLNVTNNFTCTPTAGGTLTFTNITAGQSGFIELVNGANYAIAAAATTKVPATLLTTISATGTYIISYFSDGTNVFCATAGAMA